MTAAVVKRRTLKVSETPYETVPPEVDATPEESFAPEPFLPYAGAEPEPFGGEAPSEPVAPQPEPDLPFYYHAWAPNLTVRRGRPEGFRFRGARYQPRTEQQNANARAYLAQVVPGGNPDRWMGDTPGFTREVRCPECGFFTSNLDVMDDHNQHTKHHVRIPDL